MELILWPTAKDLVTLRPHDRSGTEIGTPPEWQNSWPHNGESKTGCVHPHYGADTLIGWITSQGGLATPAVDDPNPPVRSMRDWELKKRLVMGLVKCAKHDFHRDSETHLFFACYAQKSLIRAFHPYRDQAFASYVVLANRLAMASENHRIEEWLSFIETAGDQPPDKVGDVRQSLPCSGVVNARIGAPTELALRDLAGRLKLPLGKLSTRILEAGIIKFKKELRRKGIDEAAAEVRVFYCEQVSDWTQHTLRVGQTNHALLLGIARQLSISVSALASYLIHTHLPDSLLDIAKRAKSTG